LFRFTPKKFEIFFFTKQIPNIVKIENTVNGLTWKVEVKLPDLGLETAEEFSLARYRTQREGVGHFI
jgi:hypothetical protein